MKLSLKTTSPPSGAIGAQCGAISKAIIFLLLILCAIYFYQQHRKPVAIAPPKVAMKKLPVQPVAVEKNSLVLDAAAPSGAIDVLLYQPIDLNYKSKSDVLQLRSMLAQKHSQLLSGQYEPSSEVFGQIVDGLPWVGMQGRYHGPGPRVIEGSAEESRFLMNPYLLVGPNFHGNRNGNTQMRATTSPDFELDCAPRNLVWQPREANAEVSYAAECVAAMVPKFDLIAYNARDMGLPYIYVSYADSKNIFKQQTPTTAYANPQYIHQGGSCGFAGGCNTLSPRTPPIDDIEIAELPATVVVWLWRENPIRCLSHPTCGL